MVTSKQSRLDAPRASLSNVMYERSNELPENWGAGSGWSWREGTEVFSRISADERKTHCLLACTLCAPPRLSRLGLLSLGFGGVPHSYIPSGAGRPLLSSHALAANTAKQPLISTTEPPASIWQAVGGFDGLFPTMKLIWFLRAMRGKQNLPINSHMAAARGHMPCSPALPLCILLVIALE